jgi:hypothetical protein
MCIMERMADIALSTDWFFPSEEFGFAMKFTAAAFG